METTQPIDVYLIITNRIIDQLKKEIIPWRKPWTEAGHPQNLLTKRPYRGINVMLLASLGYTQNYFLTLKQVNAVGGTVRKGEKGHVVVYGKKIPQQTTESQENKPSRSVLRYYYVFNIEQCDHLPEVLSIPYPVHLISQIGACDEIIERMPNCPEIKHGKHQAYYDPVKDYITIPTQGSFASPESYYSTLFHELIHSTGHPTRLNRKGIVENQSFGSIQYSFEELVAEIGATYLNAVSGIMDKEFESNVAYIQGWIEVLQKDIRMIVYASSHAQRATDTY
jgi:antirestriction protein ArdC